MNNERGQLLPAVIVLLLMLAITIPAMVLYVQHEARWTTKAQQATNAFQLAEGAVDRGYQKLTESTSTWNALMAGTQIDNYHFDYKFTDLAGGYYTIGISSGPEDQQATIIGIGKDYNGKETRALQVVYANAPLGSNAIRSQSGVSITGNNVEVEWGSVMAQTSIATNSRNHPRFYSAGSITPQDSNGATPPNTDSVQWWSYYTSMPDSPYIDFDYYKSSAQASGTYYSGTQNWAPPCGDATSCNTGKTYYIDGDLNVSSPGIFVGGTLIVTGNVTLPNGRSGQGSPSVPLPTTAWKEYGNDWDFYKAGGTACSQSWSDVTAPVSFPGLNSSYTSPSGNMVTFSDSKVMVNGFLYVGGNLTQSGGSGQTKVVGSAYVGGSVSLGANNICVFRTDAASSQLKTTRLVLTRQSWQEVLRAWPSGL